MRRKDCYFGLHFDFHANRDTRDIGKEFDTKVLERIIKEVKPDYIQCDAKGHTGYSSYPTKVGTPAPELKTDILRGWREVTAEYGVSLFSHYSGIWDKKAMSDHPEWAATGRDGRYTDRASVFGGYADNLLIPQLKELIAEYGIDGAWVDGECWALALDYGKNAEAVWKNATGKEVPSEDGTDYPCFLDFQKKAFFSYVKHYIDEIKKFKPDFDITSNWLNTSWVPDDVRITDYISGDLSPTNSVDSARFDGRIMQSFGRNWDIMSWGISFPVHYVKSAVQLCQEAAVILSLGGGFQIYNMQSPQKVVMDEWAIPNWAETAKFCRDRQPYCHGGEILPDVGILYSAAAYYDKNKRLFFRDCEYNMELYGILTAFCDLGRSVSVVLSERAVKGDVNLSEYSTLVVSNLTALEKGMKEKLLAYVAAGGNLMLFGKDTAELFADELKLNVGRCTENPIVVAEGIGYSVEIRSPYAKIRELKNSNTIYMRECVVSGDLNCTNPPPTITPKKEKIVAFTCLSYGKGNVGIMPVNIGRLYFDENTYELKRFFRDCMRENEHVRVSLNKKGEADILLTKKEGREYLHLVNILGEHRSGRIKTFDAIPPVYGLEVVYNSGRKPKRVLSRPGGIEQTYTYADGTVKIEVDRIDLYEILEIIY